MKNSEPLLSCNVKAELAIRNLIDFVEYTKPDYQAKWFHHYVCSIIQDWHKGIGSNRLMIFMPPQHGKSELSTRRTPAWILGHNPNVKIGIAAYNHTIAAKFNRDVQRIITSDQYAHTFPNTKLNENRTGGHIRNNDEFEIVGKSGSLVSVGVGGGLTSRQIDVMIIDDVYKDQREAWSPVQRANVSEWYSNVVETRLHNDSKVLIVFTRWHEEDLGGELLKEQPGKWDVVKFPAVKVDDADPDDPREIGHALWPEKHDIEKLLDIQRRNKITFANLYQQDPQPMEGLLYTSIKTYSELPEFKGRYQVKAYIDTADTGSDYLCSVVYIAREGYYYVTDVIYDQSSAEVTEPLTARQMDRNNVSFADVESNNGGRAFARNIDRIKHGSTVVNWFHQSQNKIARIHSSAATVQDKILMPEDWHVRWPMFYQAVTRYSAQAKNEHDDAPDVLTGIIDKNEYKRPSQSKAHGNSKVKLNRM